MPRARSSLAAARALALTLTALTAPRIAGASKPEVEQLAQQADRARIAGDLDAGLDLLRRAYALDPLPVLLNNIARALEELGRYREAAETYERLLTDPRTEPALAAKDRARLDALRPRLDRAYVQLDVALLESQLYADGLRVHPHPLTAKAKELELDPGRHVLEHSRDGIDATLRFVLLLRDTIALSFKPAADDATLTLPTARIPLRALAIDGYPVHTAIGTLERVRLPAADHRLEVKLDDGTTLTRTVRLAPAQELALEDLLREQLTLAPAITTAPKLETPRERSAAPWITGSAGAVACAAGTVLELLARSDRDRVRTAIDGEPVVHSLTMSEAATIRDRANLEASAGAIAIGAGVAAIAAGITWWLLDGAGPAQ